MASFECEEFLTDPKVERLRECVLRKDDWMKLAENYDVPYKRSWRKAVIRNAVIQKLVVLKIFDVTALGLCEELEDESDAEIKRLEIIMEEKKILLREKELEQEKMLREKELEQREKERQFQLQMLEKQAQLGLKGNKSVLDNGSAFDVSKCIKLVPSFEESDPAEFFIQFSRIANSLKWPGESWPVLVQSALKGKGRTAYLALDSVQSKDYDVVKETVLKAYQLTSEYYRNKFRNTKKESNVSYIEYAHVTEKLLDRWLESAEVEDFQGLKEQIALEQYCRGVPQEVKIYLLEKEVTTLQRAACLAENYSLIHKSKTNDKPVQPISHVSKKSSDTSVEKNESESQSSVKKSSQHTNSSGSSKIVCYFCKKRGHIASNCWKKQAKATGEQDTHLNFAVSVEAKKSNSPVRRSQASFKPFQTKGWVSLKEDSLAFPIKIMRDTCSSHSVVAKDLVPFVEDCWTGESVVLEGIGGPVTLPLCKLFLKSGFGSQYIVAAVKESLPVEQVALLLGNDIAGENVLPDPVVTFRPSKENLTAELENKVPGIFPSCVVTRSQVCKSTREIDNSLGNENTGTELLGSPCLEDDNDVTSDSKYSSGERSSATTFYSDSFNRDSRAKSDSEHSSATTDYDNSFIRDSRVKSDSSECSRATADYDEYSFGQLFKESDSSVSATSQIAVDKSGVHGSSDVVDLSNTIVTRDMLIKAQHEDSELLTLFSKSVSENELEKERTCYYIKDGVLMRKFRPPDAPTCDTWREVHQIVVPACYRNKVMEIAHDYVGGHLGVRKTTSKVLCYFFWNGIWRDIAKYCKSCEICQRVGKPNKPIKPAPLQPIPVLDEPFTKVIIDCVGPLPQTKAGHKYLLTIMCATSRFPEAIPLKQIKAKNIIPVLTKFFTAYGFPKIIQSDRGSNFTSEVFQEVMSTLGIQQYLATSYHPQSQGALERFHQTLKNLLSKYCMEHEKDWDTGVPFVLYAVRSTVQESLGFSPYQLLFGREIRGPLKLLKESWVSSDNTVDLTEYTCNLKMKLNEVHKLAKSNLSKVQSKMKSNFDKKSESRAFMPGDKVLLFMPSRRLPLQCKYEGPFLVLKKINDVNYIISTPGRLKTKRMVHINLLKAYHSRGKEVSMSVVKETSEVLEAGSENFSNGVKLQNSDVLNHLDDKLSHLSQGHRKQIAELLFEFQDLCGNIPLQSNLLVHDVELEEGARPVRQSPYRLTPQKREALGKEVEFLLENNLAVPSQSQWASPCILVPKGDGTFRMCTDFRKVNQLTISDSYPLPRIDDIIDEIGNATFVTKLDLLRGYYQVRLSPRAQKISAFITPNGLFEYTVMPFGMKNSASTFQRLMNSVISGMKNVQAYLDDLVVYSSTWEEHLSTLCELFRRLRSANLTINLTKSEFVHARVKYLGHFVGGGEVSPLHSKVDAIDKFPIPSSRKEVQRFIGMIGYYRRFCPNFSQVAAPLTDLMSSKKKFQWTDLCQRAFVRLKLL